MIRLRIILTARCEHYADGRTNSRVKYYPRVWRRCTAQTNSSFAVADRGRVSGVFLNHHHSPLQPIPTPTAETPLWSRKPLHSELWIRHGFALYTAYEVWFIFAKMQQKVSRLPYVLQVLTFILFQYLGQYAKTVCVWYFEFALQTDGSKLAVCIQETYQLVNLTTKCLWPLLVPASVRTTHRWMACTFYYCLKRNSTICFRVNTPDSKIWRFLTGVCTWHSLYLSWDYGWLCLCLSHRAFHKY